MGAIRGRVGFRSHSSCRLDDLSHGRQGGDKAWGFSCVARDEGSPNTPPSRPPCNE